MGRTKSNLIELFADKAVLAIAAIIALWILLAFVIGSPNSVKQGGKKISPSKIDEFVREDAEKLQKKLQEKVQDDNSYKPQTSIYLDLIKNSIKNTDTTINFPLPGSPATDIDEKRVYQLPKIEQIEKPSIAVVTMAAFIPIEELPDDLTYDKAETRPQPEDVDLVTVESSINAKQLYEDFHSAFAGKNLQNEWKEEQYAKPVFVKVELQRRTLLEDGSWGEWAEVPKIKTCHLKKTRLPAQADEYGIQIALEQFSKEEIRDEILQPPVYDNAIPTEKWICPSLYTERQKKLEKEKEEIKKQGLEAEKARKLQERAAPRRQPTGSRTTPAPLPKTKTPPSAPSAADNKQEAKTEEQQFKDILLSEKTTPASLEKLVFWAHDDTAKPGEKYQYRIRVGVLNPIAGKPWFSEEQKDLRNETVLFSNFSESNPNKPVEIPRHLYFFATDNRENEKGGVVDKIVEIKVARYTLGNWITKTFNVKTGDQIGAVIDAAGTKLEKAGIRTDSIDLSTGNVMVDTRRVTEWSGTASLRAKDFYELLYCKPGRAIQTMPIKERYWPEEIAKIYKEIAEAEAAEPVTLSGRSEAASGARTKTSSKPSVTSPGETIAPPR